MSPWGGRWPALGERMRVCVRVGVRVLCLLDPPVSVGSWLRLL